ncbi:hypothetical protein [Peptoanaerobacter stomatis]|uniref:Uncharacterized protein n=1 Tax=Peptoanaerobacter stomatis TaxID=796937 RepID=G9WXU8_9FIRM|nr:hypothetical protein [Peptoanaerobacter stomatis]EHL16945.1 hypothetical protein HMPREF9629_00187 [Peptoanaerobacter stomatis]
MKEITSFVYDNPWIIFVVMTIMFYVSIGCLAYRQSKRKKAFKMIKSMRNNNELSKVYLRIDNGYGDFYDVAVSSDGETWHKALFSEEVVAPSILLSPGQYTMKFSVKSRSVVSAYHSKKGVFYTEVTVEPFVDTIIVFDNDTLDSWQEDYKEEYLNE